MSDIDPKDAATLLSVIEDDHFAGPGEHGRRTLVVRLKKEQALRPCDVPFGSRVRPLYGATTVVAYVVFASTYSRYEASRIRRELARFDGRTCRLTTVRALMHSVRLPEVKETVEYEEAL